MGIRGRRRWFLNRGRVTADCFCASEDFGAVVGDLHEAGVHELLGEVERGDDLGLGCLFEDEFRELEFRPVGFPELADQVDMVLMFDENFFANGFYFLVLFFIVTHGVR